MNIKTMEVIEMKNDVIINGVRLGEYDLSIDTVIEQINEKCISRGMNYVAISMFGTRFNMTEQVEQHHFIEWAKYCAENKVYFSIPGGGQRPHAGFTKETAKKMKEIAGEYFLSYSLGELGTSYACTPEGYPCKHDREWKDIKDASQCYVEKVREHAENNKMDCDLPTTVIEPTAMISYNAEAGITFPTMEFWPGDFEISAAFTRGTANAYSSKLWGTYFAHEWYAGMYLDKMKTKRLKMGYDYCYMAGGNAFVLESGDENIYTHGVALGYDNEISKNYRKVMEDFAEFAKKDGRPVGGPKVKVAFVRGNCDGFSFFRAGGSVWRGNSQPEFGYSAPEFMWRILDNIKGKRTWDDVYNYGDVDLSGAPAGGVYDVIPANVGADVFAKYDYLIFVGWNTMTDEIYKNLKAYVEQGGRLFMCAAHLNTSAKRNGEISLVNDGDVSDLFGCKLDSENIVHTPNGSKFTNSLVPEIKYCATKITTSDPYFAEGYIKYAKAELTTGQATAKLSNTFWNKNDADLLPASLVENKCGDGYAILMTCLEYPSGAGFSMYQSIVREILTASHRNSDIKVYGGDSLRFAVYDRDKVYLLNTDFDNKIFATIDYGTEKREFVLEPCEFKAIERESL